MDTFERKFKEEVQRYARQCIFDDLHSFREIQSLGQMIKGLTDLMETKMSGISQRLSVLEESRSRSSSRMFSRHSHSHHHSHSSHHSSAEQLPAHSYPSASRAELRAEFVAETVVVRRAFWLSFSGRSISIIGNGWEFGYPLLGNCA